MEWEDVGFIKASKIRHDIFFLIMDHPFTPKEIQQELNVHFSQVSLALREMKSRNLIECVTANLKKGRFYVLTEEGKNLIPILKNLEP